MALLESCNCPWACLGDFNFTLEDNEISTNGSRGAGDSKNNFLKELVFEFGAIDLGYSGNAFTWARGKWGSAAIKRRLDRTIANISWRLAFPDATVTHLGAINSDHKPILLDTNPSQSFANRPFRFEAAWVRDNGCNSVVEETWNGHESGSEFEILKKKQEATRIALRKWNKQVFGNCQDRINRLMGKINEVQRRQPSEENGKIEEAL